MGYRKENFAAKAEENAAVQEAASGLESVEKLIKLLQSQKQYHSSSCSSLTPKPYMEIEMDCRAVADAAVSKFKRVISLLGRTRTGHARFRRAPLPPPQQQTQQPSETPIAFHATPLQQIPPPPPLSLCSEHQQHPSSSKNINFSSYNSSATNNSFVSSLTGDTDTKQPCASSPAAAVAFQITNLSQVSSAGKPPLSSSSLKRKCSSENLGSGKCGSSSGRCHCSKKRYVMGLHSKSFFF